jgi:hypothetical protein
VHYFCKENNLHNKSQEELCVCIFIFPGVKAAGAWHFSTKVKESVELCLYPHICACVKDSVYVPPLPMSLKELRDWITHALEIITVDMLHRVWDEFDYRVDVCHVTQGAHFEGL